MKNPTGIAPEGVTIGTPGAELEEAGGLWRVRDGCSPILGEVRT